MENALVITARRSAGGRAEQDGHHRVHGGRVARGRVLRVHRRAGVQYLFGLLYQDAPKRKDKVGNKSGSQGIRASRLRKASRT